MAEEKEKNLEVMRQAMGPDVSPRPGSEFDELDSRSVDSFLEAEDVPQDTVNHRRDAAAVALYSDNTNTPGKFSGSNPTSKLSGSRSLEMTVDRHAYVTTRNGYNSSSTDGSSKKTSSKSKNSSSNGSSNSAQKNNQQGHHHHRNQQQQGRRK
eukprot:gene22286-30529_t